MPVYKANALVLRRIPLGEKDKILTLFTREWGKLSAVAKGARKTTSRLAGASEPLMFVRVLLAEGMNLDVFTQGEIRESFPTVRADFGRYLRATYCCELMDRITEERNPDQQAFDLLLSTLYILQRAVDPDVPVLTYELQLMAHEGYEPRLDSCARCEEPFDEGETVGRTAGIMEAAYSAVRGGALCQECADAAREETLPFRPETAALMRRLTREENARALAALQMPPPVAAEANRAVRAHLRYRLERDIRSTAFLDAYRIGAMDGTELLTAPDRPEPVSRPAP